VRGSDFGFTSSTSNSLYGIKKFGNFYVSAVRHIVTPKLSFNYAPDFSKNERFYNFGGVGLSSSSKQKRLKFTLENKWQLKLKAVSNRKEKKLNDFISTNSNISYDFEKDEKPFSDIGHSVKLRPGKISTKYFVLSISPHGTVTQKTYDLNFKGFNPQKWNFGVSYWSFKLSSKLTFSGDAQYLEYFPHPANRFVSNKFFEHDSLDTVLENEITTLQELEELDKEKKSWSLSFSHTFKTNKNTFENKDYSSNLRTSLTAKITRNWSVSYDNHINLKEKETVSHNITFTRELHCWKMYFRYTKYGEYWNYQFKVFNVKLPDSLMFRKSDHKKYY
jgi:hypothetical protein